MGAGVLEEEVDKEERREVRGGGEVDAFTRLKAKHALVSAGARVLFYPTLLYNVLRSRFEAEFRWCDRINQAHGINHLEIPTRDCLFAPSLEDICRAMDS